MWKWILGIRHPSKRNVFDGNALPKAVQRAYAASRRRRRLEAPTILGEVRVSKARSRKRTTPRQKRKAPESEPAIEDIPQNSVPRPAKRRENRPRPDANAKSPSTRRSYGGRQKRPLDVARSNHRQSLQRLQPAHVGLTTRSGRTSRQPERY